MPLLSSSLSSLSSFSSSSSIIWTNCLLEDLIISDWFYFSVYITLKITLKITLQVCQSCVFNQLMPTLWYMDFQSSSRWICVSNLYWNKRDILLFALNSMLILYFCYWRKTYFASFILCDQFCFWSESLHLIYISYIIYHISTLFL
jgi:hypothetical protein